VLSIQKILVPVVFADTSRQVVHHAPWLARRFHAEIIPVPQRDPRRKEYVSCAGGLYQSLASKPAPVYPYSVA